MPSVKAVEAVDRQFALTASRTGHDLTYISVEEWEAVKDYIEELEAEEVRLNSQLDRYSEPLRDRL